MRGAGCGVRGAGCGVRGAGCGVMRKGTMDLAETVARKRCGVDVTGHDDPVPTQRHLPLYLLVARVRGGARAHHVACFPVKARVGCSVSRAGPSTAQHRRHACGRGMTCRGGYSLALSIVASPTRVPTLNGAWARCPTAHVRVRHMAWRLLHVPTGEHATHGNHARRAPVTALGGAGVSTGQRSSTRLDAQGISMRGKRQATLWQLPRWYFVVAHGTRPDCASMYLLAWEL